MNWAKLGLAFYILSVSALLVAELKQARFAQYYLKPVAAMGFVLLAVQNGALDTDYGLLVLTGLSACAIGDILLLSRSNQMLFKMGMSAFGTGHFFYILAANMISRPDLSIYIRIGSFLIGLAVIWLVFRYFKSRVPKEMVWPVGAYAIIIVLMCVYAAQSDFVGSYALIFPAALLFAVSDIFVARDRFIKPDPRNAVMITPLYFAAQALFALSVA